MQMGVLLYPRTDVAAMWRSHGEGSKPGVKALGPFSTTSHGERFRLINPQYTHDPFEKRRPWRRLQAWLARVSNRKSPRNVMQVSVCVQLVYTGAWVDGWVGVLTVNGVIRRPPPQCLIPFFEKPTGAIGGGMCLKYTSVYPITRASVDDA